MTNNIIYHTTDNQLKINGKYKPFHSSFLKKSKKGSKMTKRHPSGWNTFQKSYVIINVQKNTFYFKKVGTNHTGLPLL